MPTKLYGHPALEVATFFGVVLVAFSKMPYFASEPVQGDNVEAVAFQLALRVFSTITMTMFISRLLSLPILYLLIISLLISQPVTPGYTWGVAADKYSLRTEVVAGDCASDNYVANATYRWEQSFLRKGHQPDISLGSIASATALFTHGPRPERDHNSHRVIAISPRISGQILHHRTIVLLI